MVTFKTINLGCKVNSIEIEWAAKALSEAGYTRIDKGEAEIALINTCTVTQRADAKSLQAIRKCLHRDRVKHLFVTGCYSELTPDLKQKIPEIRAVISQDQKEQAAEIILNTLATFISSEMLFAKGDPEIGFKSSKTRTFIKVQDGCKNFCTYCKIPFARGLPVSRPTAKILDEIRQAKAPEVILSGINIGDFKEGGNGFAELVETLLSTPDKARIRISSIEPLSVTDKLISLFEYKRLCPHLHLPLQAGADKILNKMNRKYLSRDYLELVAKLRRINPHFSISTDIIVGFPGESETDFQATLEMVRKCSFSKIHIFPFSPREGTRAEKLEETVTQAEKKKRLAVLKAAAAETEALWRKKTEQLPQTLIIETVLNKKEFSKKFADAEVSAAEEGVFVEGITEYYRRGWLQSRLPAAKKGDLVSITEGSFIDI